MKLTVFCVEAVLCEEAMEEEMSCCLLAVAVAAVDLISEAALAVLLASISASRYELAEAAAPSVLATLEPLVYLSLSSVASYRLP